MAAPDWRVGGDAGAPARIIARLVKTESLRKGRDERQTEGNNGSNEKEWTTKEKWTIVAVRILKKGHQFHNKRTFNVSYKTLQILILLPICGTSKHVPVLIGTMKDFSSINLDRNNSGQHIKLQQKKKKKKDIPTQMFSPYCTEMKWYFVPSQSCWGNVGSQRTLFHSGWRILI